MPFLIFVIVAFLIGSIPFGYIAAKLKGIDIRQEGSGNIGATNVARVISKRTGACVLLADILKGTIATGIPLLLLSEPGNLQLEYNVASVSGLAAICGHCFSPFLRFTGGKGVATAVGAYAIIAPAALGFALVIFAAVVYVTHYVALGSISAAIALPVFAAVFPPDHFSTILILSTIATSALIVARHRGNISRLKSGTENKF